MPHLKCLIESTDVYSRTLLGRGEISCSLWGDIFAFALLKIVFFFLKKLLKSEC